MRDYSDIGLNNKLQAVTSLAARKEFVYSPSQYDIEAITGGYSKIVSLNSSRTGTLALGGTRNSDGVLSITASNGTEGILVNGSQMVIRNDAGTQVLLFPYTDNIFQMHSLDLGRPGTTASGQLRLYDSGIVFVQIEVTTEALFNLDTRIGNDYGLTLGGTATQVAPAANRCTLFVDNGGASSKNRLMAIFDTGAAQVVASEP